MSTSQGLSVHRHLFLVLRLEARPGAELGVGDDVAAGGLLEPRQHRVEELVRIELGAMASPRRSSVGNYRRAAISRIGSAAPANASSRSVGVGNPASRNVEKSFPPM